MRAAPGAAETKTHLEENKQEIADLIDAQLDALGQATNVEEVKEIIEETKDRIALKTYDGVTIQDALEETIQVPGGVAEQQVAIEAVLDVIEAPMTITLQIRTVETKEQILAKFAPYDTTVSVRLLFTDDAVSYREVSFSKSSLITEELLSEIDTGILPDALLGYDVVKPEVYTIGQIDVGGEELPFLR